MRPYRQARIWAYLREHPGARLRDIHAAVPSMSYECASRTLRRMEAGGSAKHSGASWQAKWFALGDAKPADGRGKQPGSVKPLIAEYRANWRTNLAKANDAAGRKTKRPLGCIDTQRLNQSCELARSWSRLATIPCVANSDEP